MNSLEKVQIMAVGGKSPSGKAAPMLKHAVELTGVETQAKVLIIPTAKPTAVAHAEGVDGAKKLYVEQLGLPTRSLHEFDQMPKAEIVDELLEWADLVYINGGDSKRMMEIWQRYGIDAKLKTRALGGLMISGVSAGAIASFAWGHSDWEHYHIDGDAWQYQPVEALGLVRAAVTPHANSEHLNKQRQTWFKEMFGQMAASSNSRVGFAIDNFAGVKIHDNRIEVKSADDGAGVTLFDARGQEMTSSRLVADEQIELSELGLS